MTILKVVLLLAAIPAAIFALIHLALRVLRWARANRGDAAMELSTGLLPQWMTDGIDSWLDDAASGSAAEHTDAGGDHHHDGGDHGH